MIRINLGKANQSGEGQTCAIPAGPSHRCPIKALINWREASGRYSGDIFLQTSKSGKVLEKPITPEYFNKLFKMLVKEAKLLDANLMSAHSLRRGFATESARLGSSLSAIRQHGRWRSSKTVFEYIEAGRQFTDNAVHTLFKDEKA